MAKSSDLPNRSPFQKIHNEIFLIYFRYLKIFIFNRESTHFYHEIFPTSTKKTLTSNTILPHTLYSFFMQAMKLFRAFIFLPLFFITLFPVVTAYSPEPGTDDPPAFYSCFYLGNIVDDTQDLLTADLENNLVTFHDGRAIQLFVMGKLTDGHTKDYIEANKSQISDFARAVAGVSERGGEPDWYDGRVASLTGLLYCANDDRNSDGLSDTNPRATCPNGIQSLFPEGSVLERVKQYLQPCCVLSGTNTGEKVDFFPCALQ